MKAIIKGVHLIGAFNIYSRHTTPIAFCHIAVDTVDGVGYSAINEAASGIFVVGHPTLGLWSTVGANFKNTEGGPIHMISGITPDPIPEGEPVDQPFTSRAVVEIFALGHMRKYVNGTARDKSRYLGMQITDATLIDSIKPAAIVWQTGDAWSAVDQKYKRHDGSPLVDPDAVQRDIPIIYG